MRKKRSCCFFFFDYKDFDVFLNARAFYRLAGFTLISTEYIKKCDLLVVFRGLPSRIYNEYTGPVHYYDYVCEHSFNIKDYFPNASSIHVVTLRDHSIPESSVKYIFGYLPVIPLVWSFKLPFTCKSSLPIHVSNFKPILGDRYQHELISLIKQRQIRTFGSKWDRIEVKATPLSFLAANLKLANSYLCYGLMYPYQRGKSLSGRMWQAPIHGCIVISEQSTNILSCPGVLEVDSFVSAPIPNLSKYNAFQLSKISRSFWLDKTIALAADLNLNLHWNNLYIEIIYARASLLCQHYVFLLNSLILPPFVQITTRSRSLLKRLLRKIDA